MLTKNMHDKSSELSQEKNKSREKQSLYDYLGLDDLLRDDPWPKIDAWDISKESETGICHVNLTYKIGAEYNYVFSLPVFADLVEKPYSNEYLIINAGDLSNLQPQEPSNNFLNFAYSKLIASSMGGATLVDAVSLVGWPSGNQSLTAKSWTMSPLSREVFLAVSLFYFSRPIYIYMSHSLRNHATSKITEIERDIKVKRIHAAHYKLATLKNKSILLQYTNNRDLAWKCCYLDGCIGEEWGQTQRAEDSYEQALRLSITDDERFLSLKGLINACIKIRREPYKMGEDYDTRIRKYMSQIPWNSDACLKDANDLRTNLKNGLEELVNRNYVSAYEKFNEVKFDHFSAKIYFGEAVIFYQLKIALILIGHKENFGNLDAESRLKTAEADLDVIRSYVCEHYPDKLEVVKTCISSFENLINAGLEYDRKKRANRTITPMLTQSRQNNTKVSLIEDQDEGDELLNDNAMRLEMS